MNRVLGVALAVAVAGGAAFAVVPAALARADRADLVRARRFAETLPDVEGAVRASDHDCHGDGKIRCVRVARDVEEVTNAAASLVRARGASPTVTCAATTDLDGTPLRDCFVRVRTGHGHAAFVRVTGPVRGPSLVNVSAS